MRTHGQTVGKKPTRTYRAWCSMYTRCFDPKCRNFADYGGRGITICARWRTFENFLADMDECPVGRQLDRENVNGNYEPGNCRWATFTEQQRNKRNNRLLTIKGETLCIADWSDRSGIPQGTIFDRFMRLKWDAERAVFHPVRAKTTKRNP